jgi:hypothetical protein
MGVGFSANDRVTLSAGFLGAYVSPSKLNHATLQGSWQEPMRMRFAVTVQRNCKIIEPFAEVGMTYGYPASRIGIVWTY